MYLSLAQEALTDAYIDANLFADHYDLMRRFTVKLTGTVFGHNVFTGTGVIYRADSDGIYILTAKHNLHIAAKGSGTLDSGLADYFKSKIRVFFTAVGGDVNAPPFFDFLSDEEVEAVLANGEIESWKELHGQRTNHVLLQFGHGHVTRGGLDGFSRRALGIAALTERTRIATTDEGFTDVFTFKTNADNTALTGDSGGPIFAIDDKGECAWLIGLHLGANFYADRTDNSDDIKNNAFTVLTSDLLDKLP